MAFKTKFKTGNLTVQIFAGFFALVSLLYSLGHFGIVPLGLEAQMLVTESAILFFSGIILLAEVLYEGKYKGMDALEKADMATLFGFGIGIMATLLGILSLTGASGFGLGILESMQGLRGVIFLITSVLVLREMFVE